MSAINKSNNFRFHLVSACSAFYHLFKVMCSVLCIKNIFCLIQSSIPSILHKVLRSQWLYALSHCLINESSSCWTTKKDIYFHTMWHLLFLKNTRRIRWLFGKGIEPSTMWLTVKSVCDSASALYWLKYCCWFCVCCTNTSDFKLTVADLCLLYEYEWFQINCCWFVSVVRIRVISN
jgi:hypothetical protein